MPTATASPVHTSPAPRDRRPARTVIAGYDRSDHSVEALLEAAERAGPSGRVVVVHVVDQTPAQMLESLSYEHLRGEHDRLVEAVGAEIAALDLGPAVEVEIVSGPAAEALTRMARVYDADELVIGARRMGALRSALTSTSRRVIALADRPVVVVPRVRARSGRGESRSA